MTSLIGTESISRGEESETASPVSEMLIRSASTGGMLPASEQIHHCPPYLTPDRKFHSYAESPVYLWDIFMVNIKELSVVEGGGEDSGRLVL